MKNETSHSGKEHAPAPEKEGKADSPSKNRRGTSAKPASARGGVSLPRSAAPAPQKTKKPDSKKAVAQSPEPDEGLMDAVLEDLVPEPEVPSSSSPEEATPLKENPETMKKANTIFRRIKERRERQEEERLSAMELVCKRSGMTEDDVEMLFELGYEYELGKIVGYDNIRRLKCDRLRRFGKSTDDAGSVSFGYRGEEYLTADSKERILTAFAKDRKLLILRTVLTALITLLLFVLGASGENGSWSFAPLREYPWLLFAFSVGLLVTATALSFRQLLAGLSDLLRFQPTPYTIPAVLLLLVFPYEILSAVFKAPAFSFCFPAAASLLLLALCDVLRYASELRSFRIFSAEGRKFVLDEVEPHKKKLRQGNRLVRILNDDIGEKFYRVRTVDQCTGFFRRCNQIFAASAQWNILLLAAFGLSLTAGFVTAFISGSFFAAAKALISVFMASLPVHGIFCFFYPVCYSNLLLSRYNCTLAGRGAEEEFEEEKTIIFDDSDLLCVTKYKETALAGNDDLRNDGRLAKILFRKLGGTIAQLGEPAPKVPDPSVKVIRIEDSGVEAVADNCHHLLAGSAAFMKKSGIPVPAESSDVSLERSADASPLYVAIDGVLKLKYEINYGFTPAFEELTYALSDDVTSVGIHTYNPNLNNAFLASLCQDNDLRVRVCKPGRYEADSAIELSDTGAVALGNREDLVYPVCAAREIRRVDRLGWYLRLASLLIGTAATAVLLILGHSDRISGLAIVAYQAFWLLPAAIASHIRINRHTLHIRK